MSKIKCDSCGKEVNSDSNFCIYCGSSLKKSKGLLSRLINVFTFNKSPKETYDYILNNKDNIEKFNSIFTNKEYIDKNYQKNLEKDYEINYQLCLKLKNYYNESKIELNSQELESINLFIDNYRNMDIKIKQVNENVINGLYQKFKENMEIYKDFVDKYKVNISYDELISGDIKEDFKENHDLIKTLINFEKSYGYDFGSNKKLIHEFDEVYSDLDNIIDKINNEVDRRKKIICDFENIKPDITDFVKIYGNPSTNLYVEDYKSILNENEINYLTCLQLKDECIEYDDVCLNKFLSIYDDFENVSHDINIKYINKIYSNFLSIKKNVEKFVNDYKTNINYEKELTVGLKEEFDNEANICQDLIKYELTDNYDLKENKKLIHDFNDLYSDFDEIVEKINLEFNRRNNIVLNFKRNRDSIQKFIKYYKENDSVDLFIEDYKSILNNHKKEYASCFELSKLPEQYHEDYIFDYLELYENFEVIANNINKKYIEYRYNFYSNNKSEITQQINKYQNITVDEYLKNKTDFIAKFHDTKVYLTDLIEHDYDFDESDLFSINSFLNLYDDFNGRFTSKFYNSFLNYKSADLYDFMIKYDENSCKYYIFDKDEELSEYLDLYDYSKDYIKLINSNELQSQKIDDELVLTFVSQFENFDEFVYKNNLRYVEKLNNEFLNKKESILNFISNYSGEKNFDYYIEDNKKSEILNFNKGNYDLAKEIVIIPEIENHDAENFVEIYENFDQNIFKLNKKYVNNLYESNLDGIDEYVSLINLSQDFYLSNSKLNELLNNHKHYLNIVSDLLRYCEGYDYLEDKKKLIEFPNDPNNLSDLTDDANESFIKRELKDNENLFDNVVKGKPLDENQRKAVIIDEDNTQIIAGAGCGKTLTLQAKAKYLIYSKGINPEEILAISFSKLAQGDLKRKMSEIGVNIDVSTFHSLGLTTLRKNNIKANVLEYGLKDAIKEYFLVKVLNDVDKIQKIIEYFGYYMYAPLDKEEIENIGEVYDYERGMDLETLYSKFEKLKDPTLKKTTLQGEKVKSLEERRIANFLFINGIKYTYEKSYEAKIDWQKTHDYLEKIILNDISLPKFVKNNLIQDILDYLELDEYLEWPRGGIVEKYHPDFYLGDYDIYYEHFGVNRKCLAPWLPRKQSREYKKEMRNKRFLHIKYGTKLIETYSYYQSENRLLDRLSEKLIDCGVEFKKMDYTQFMIDLLNDEEKINEYWDFIKLVETFINLFKGNGYEKDKFIDFNKENDELTDGFLKDKHRLFLEIVEDIYDYYHEYLKKHNAIDFNDMINNATKVLKNNDFYKDYKYIMVDEFQDTSHTRFNFLKTLRNKLNSKLIVVGDDWQSIYRFTGCDIDLFTNFENYFDDLKTEICYITNTYRNSQSLIDVSGDFIMKNESQFKKQLNSKSKTQIDDTIKLYQYLNFLEQPYVFEAIINDIYNSSGNTKILVLGRNRNDYKNIINDELFYTSGSLNEKNLKIHYKKNPIISIRYMTVHGSKGLEEDNVVLVNLEDRKNGFPNKIEDDSVLAFVKNNKLEEVIFAEERRLFYVALTRTKKRTYLLAPKDKKSEFVNEILSDIVIADFEINNESEIYGDEIRTIASTDGVCPYCGTGKINLKFNPKTGKKFFKCSNWPKCDWYGGNFYENVEELDNPRYCPKCGGLLVKKDGFYGCINYFPDKACRYTENIN